MNQSLIASVNGKNIYLVNDPNVPFYICIPNSGNVSIVLNLVDNVGKININNSNINELTNEINNIYGRFNFSDIAVVTPVVDSNILEQVKLNNNENVFMYLDKYMGYLINTVYGYLSGNNIMVDKQVKLNNNENYKVFNEWFVRKYNGRVVLCDYSNAPVNKFENVSQTGVNEKIDNSIANSVLDDTSSDNEGEVKNTVKTTKEPGFVSYVLLGVVVAVVSLIVLYMLL